ncbi:MAG: hypothetical protein AB1458_06190 [Bacteroidota bacterium]
MKPTQDLFLLIQSLSASEKGYFKKYCLRNGEASSRNYIRLFDLVAGMKTYDEEALRGKIGEATMLRNLSSEKNYLFHLILESLVVSGSGQSVAPEMEKEMLKARVLAEKAFYENAIRFAQKVMTYCRKADNFNLWLDALELEIFIWPYLPADTRREFDDVFNEKQSVLQNIMLVEKARYFHWQVMELYNVAGMGRSSGQMEKYERVYRSSRQFHEEQEGYLPVSARILCINTEVFYHNISGNLPASCGALRQLIGLLESRSEMLAERMSLYISSINNLILVLLYLKKHDEALAEIDKLDNLKVSTPKSYNAAFVCRYNTRYELYAKQGKFSEAYLLSLKLKEELERQRNRIGLNFTIHILYYSFRACFNAGKYKEALYWINSILNSAKETVRQEALAMARISEIILHYELGNSDILDNLVGSALRYMNRNNSLNEFECIMLDFFRKGLDENDTRGSFARLKERICALEQHMLEQRVFSYFDFIAWAESKIEARPIAEILERRLAAKA